ncbi:MAG: mechanosensitive ion channel family protein [Planctomycetota bacterium]|jgi:small-conductance mechanosensitive channel
MLGWSIHLHALSATAPVRLANWIAQDPAPGAQEPAQEAPKGWSDQLAESLGVGNKLLLDLVVLIGVLVAYYLFKFVVLGAMARLARHTDNDLDDRLVHFTRTFCGWVFIFVAVIAVLKVHEVEITPLLAGAGIAGIAIGLAAKETLADILSGVFLIADQPMRIGDRVKIERIGREWGGWGDVVDIGLRRTKVRNSDGVIVNYPNSILANSVITNFSFERQPVRVRVRFQVGYDADLEQVQAVAKKAISETTGVLPDTAEVMTRSLWDVTRGHLLSGVLMEGRYRIGDVRDRTRIRSRVLQRVLADMRTAGIPLAAQRVEMAERA